MTGQITQIHFVQIECLNDSCKQEYFRSILYLYNSSKISKSSTGYPDTEIFYHGSLYFTLVAPLLFI